MWGHLDSLGGCASARPRRAAVSLDRVNWTTYGAFIVFVSALILVPGPDVAVTIKNALSGGQRQGIAAVGGVGIASLIQSSAAVTGLAVLITKAEPVLVIVKWVGAAYLLLLAMGAWRSAWRGRYPGTAEALAARPTILLGLREGFLCNITNPKIIAFNLAVFPQFLGSHPAPSTGALYAVTLPALGSLYLVALAAGVVRARAVLSRPPIRRAMDTITGVALMAFGARLVLD